MHTASFHVNFLKLVRISHDVGGSISYVGYSFFSAAMHWQATFYHSTESSRHGRKCPWRKEILSIWKIEYAFTKPSFSSTLFRTILVIGFHDVQKNDSSFCLSPDPTMPEIRHKRMSSRSRGTSFPPIFKLKERVRTIFQGL